MPRCSVSAVSTLPFLFLICLAAPATWADDWPQILGPQRNSQAASKLPLSHDWQAKPPVKVWQHQCGAGYAGAAISGGRVVLFHRQAEELVLTCLDVANGQQIWEHRAAASYRGGVDADQGPRCTPTIHGGRVYALAASGTLICVDLDAGRPLWTRQLARDYRAQLGYFGCGSSPLVLGQRLIVCLGGKPNAGVVALDCGTGKTVWTSVADQASYAAPIAWASNSRGDSKPLALVLGRRALHVLDPADGGELASHPFGKRGPTVNAATPLQVGNRVLLTASYGIGADMLSLETPAEPRLAWHADDALSAQYCSPVLIEGTVYGVDGREDVGAASLRCLDSDTGKVLWRHPMDSVAHLIAVDGKLLVVANDGHLSLVRPNAARYQELARVQLGAGTLRALPALADGVLVVRDTDGQVSAWRLPN